MVLAFDAEVSLIVEHSSYKHNTAVLSSMVTALGEAFQLQQHYDFQYCLYYMVAVLFHKQDQMEVMNKDIYRCTLVENSLYI